MSLSDNLSALSARREAAARRRKITLDTLVSLAQERTVEETRRSSLTSLPEGGPVAAPGAVQHHPGDGHDHGSMAPGKGGFNPEFNSALSRLLKDFGGKVKVNSGYRSPERQAQLFAQGIKKYGSAAAARKWVAPPGKSNHGRGLAADLGFSDAATRRLIHQNAAKYGLHFPLAHEPWHIEPIRARKR